MQTGMCLMRKSRRGVGNLRMGEKTGLNVELEDKIKAQLCAYCKHSFKAKYYRQKHLCITLWIFVFYKDEKTVHSYICTSHFRPFFHLFFLSLFFPSSSVWEGCAESLR